MKKITIVLVLVMITASLFAQVKFRMNGACDWHAEEEKSEMGGIRLELVGQELGFGVEVMGNSSCEDEPVEGETYWGEWQGEVFVNYHFFGNNSFLDPYLQAGYGCAGKDYWTVDEGSQELNISLYPSFSAGVNMVFKGGLILGIRNSYRPDNRYVPGSDLPVYDLSKNQFTLNIGHQFGGRDKRERARDERYGCWKWCWCEDGDCDRDDD